MSTRRIRTLLVEADPRAAGQYAHWTPEEWSVAVVETGEAALTAVDADTDLVVVGANLPDQPTYRLLGRIRSRGYECQLAVAGVDDDVDWGAHGADGVVPAPVDRSSFRATLDRLADRIAYDRDLEQYYSLVSDLAVMEARHTPEELVASPEYQELRERAEAVSADLDESLAEIATVDDYATVFRGFFPGETAEE